MASMLMGIKELISDLEQDLKITEWMKLQIFHLHSIFLFSKGQIFGLD